MANRSQRLDIHLITAFPEIFQSFLKGSLLGKAVANGILTVHFTNPRDFTTDTHRTIDDTPYGGGDGMVLKPEPYVAAIESTPSCDHSRKILLTPQGRPLCQAHVNQLVHYRHLTLICGRYEGFDERIRSFVDEEISVGDFVLNGGEVAAMAVIESVGRLVPGVIGRSSSLREESYEDGLLEYPQYTKPYEFRGLKVPKVLLSGHHQAIRTWRHCQRLWRTQKRRPDLWAQRNLSHEEEKMLDELATSGEMTK